MTKDQVTTDEADRLIVVLGLTIALTSGCATGTAYTGSAWGNVPFGTGMAMNLTRQENEVKGTWTTTVGRSGVLSGNLTPRWTPGNRPVVDGSKPASGRAAPQAEVLYRVPS
jgi:hypothetical protein